MGSAGSQIKAALDKGVGHSRELDSQPTATGHAYRTMGPSVAHRVVRANKLILSLLVFLCFLSVSF